MATLRFALAQHDFPVGAVAGNAARVRRLYAEGVAGGAAVVAFPELALSGYPPEDLLLRPSFLDACARELDALANAADENHAAVVGVPYRHADGTLRNSAAVLQGGHVARLVHKQVLPNYAVFDEKRYFHPGDTTCVLDVAGVRVAILICEDIWDDAPVARAAGDGAELILIVNASPWDVAKQAQREALLARHARASACAIAYVNAVGGQDDLLFDGSSMLVNADGSVVARAAAFAEALLFCEFDAATRSLRADDWPARTHAPTAAVLYAGLVRGIADYVGKNGFTDVLLGLSGGIDSSLTLALAVDALGARHVTAVMLPSRYTSRISLDGARAQADALGVDYRVLAIEDSFKAMLGTLEPAFGDRPADITEENLQARIRGTLLMALANKHHKLLLATGNKSEMAVGYATLYGDMCGAYAPLKDVYKTRVYALARWRNAVAGGTHGSGTASGLGTRDPGPGTSRDQASAASSGALEGNAGRDVGAPQASGLGTRDPGPGTSRDQASAVPLGTFEGGAGHDAGASQASGPGSPVPGPGNVIPQSVIDRAPSAELSANQTDQDSLPPYDELDAILESFIEDEKSQADIVADGHDADTVQRVVRLVLANEFKRRQAAPGPKVTRRAFGRERRYPISSGWG